MKLYLLEMGRRLVEQNILENTDDIFFFHYDELMELLEKCSTSSINENISIRNHYNKSEYIIIKVSDKTKVTPESEYADAIISRRKIEYDRLQSVPCPLHRVETSSGVRLYFPANPGNSGKFQGTGASPGQVVGKARVILSLSGGDKLQPGEILVTKSTEPSWTPLFSIAGAVVVEIGSTLSHGAIVAREIGIPAVLGIPGIVGSVRNGDMLAVDGSRGIVEVIQ